jgi:hypothetical protein
MLHPLKIKVFYVLMGPLALCAVFLLEENLLLFINSQITDANKDLPLVRHKGEVPSNHGNRDEIDCTGIIPKSTRLRRTMMGELITVE